MSKDSLNLSSGSRIGQKDVSKFNKFELVFQMMLRAL